MARDFNYTYNKSHPFEYCSAKYSKFFYEDEADNPSIVDEEDLPRYVRNNTHYMNVSLEKDSHFYNINVNTNISCVHVPTNIFDLGMLSFILTQYIFILHNRPLIRTLRNPVIALFRKGGSVFLLIASL